MSMNAARFLDLRGSFTSMGLLKASKAFQELKNGQTLVILSDDRRLREDLFRILDSRRIGESNCEEEHSVYKLSILKQPRRHPAEGDSPLESLDSGD